MLVGHVPDASRHSLLVDVVERDLIGLCSQPFNEFPELSELFRAQLVD
ncbi:MAG TPA: hypothetical protein VL334_05615 [Anaerolineae bacterium]|nr:hypothetical protein [Anaerolineae bacterium]